MTSRLEKGGATFQGIKMLLCENPLPPLPEAIEAAQAELHRSNYYTEPYSEPLRRFLAESLGVPERLIHINAGSELILRQLFDRLGQQVHLLIPTYALFPEVARCYTETPLRPEDDFTFDLARLEVPPGTSLVALVNPNNPNGGTFDMAPLPDLLRRHPATRFLVDEAFIGLAGQSVAHLVPQYANLLVTRTLSKAHSLAGFRVGYAVLPEELADDLNAHNDAYPLARPSQAAALTTLRHEDKIRERGRRLQQWTEQLAADLRALGVRTFPTATYFFLADFSPSDAADLADRLREREILIKPLLDPRLEPGFMRVTTALPEENARFLEAIKELLRAR
jgi:histidinol-phosphate aminotransferase